MTITIANTANNNTFDYWRNRTNELAYAFSTYAVTAGGSNTAAGNAAITGTFTSNNLTVNNTIKLGNSTVNAIVNTTSVYVTDSGISATFNTNYVSVGNSVFVGNSTANLVANTTIVRISNSTSNISFSMPTAAQVSSGEYYFSSNGSWVQISPFTPGNYAVTLTGTSTQNVASFEKASFNAAEYLIYALDNNANNRSVSKLIVIHDGGTSTSNAFMTEYAILNTNTAMGTYSVTTNTSHVVLRYSPVSTSVTLNYTRLVT